MHQLVLIPYAFDTGETIVSPGSREGLIPLVIPLSRKSSGLERRLIIKNYYFFFNSLMFGVIFNLVIIQYLPSLVTGALTALLRWPTSPPGYDLNLGKLHYFLFATQVNPLGYSFLFFHFK